MRRSSLASRRVPPEALDRPLPPPGQVAPKLPPPSPRIVRALVAFEEAAGGREAMVAELLHASSHLSSRESLLIQLLADPQNDSRQLADLLGSANLSVATFLRVFREARGARAYLDALDRVWSHLPDVALDVMSRALPRTRTCHACKGTGYQRLVGPRNVKEESSNPEEDKKVICPACDAKGEVTVEPTLDYHRLALQLGGLLRNQPMIQVDQSRTNLQTAFVQINDTMAKHIAATNRVLYGNPTAPDASDAPEAGEVVGEVIDAEVADPPSEAEAQADPAPPEAQE